MRFFVSSKNEHRNNHFPLPTEATQDISVPFNGSTPIITERIWWCVISNKFCNGYKFLTLASVEPKDLPSHSNDKQRIFHSGTLSISLTPAPPRPRTGIHKPLTENANADDNSGQFVLPPPTLMNARSDSRAMSLPPIATLSDQAPSRSSPTLESSLPQGHYSHTESSPRQTSSNINIIPH